MTEVPKIVYDRLRAARPERLGTELEHLDANLLTAFAEQALSAAERDGVLAHLALCGDCRDVLALALPAMDIVAVPVAAESDAVQATAAPTKEERNRLTASGFVWPKFAWPSLRWAALAAGIVVVASVFLLRPGKLNQAMLPSANPQLAASAQPASGAPVASSPSASSRDQFAVLAKAEEPRPKSELRSSKELKAGQSVTPSPEPAHGMLLAENKKDAGQADKVSPASRVGGASVDAPTRAGATEAIEVSGAAVAVDATASAESSLTARNETPAIEKAKPALPGMEMNEPQQAQADVVVPVPAKPQARGVMFAAKLASPASQVLAHNVTWTIQAGALRRSLDNGQSWQNALRADRPLLCYASHDNDVWTGGQGGTLFYSADSGVTWVQVQASVKSQQLSSDITHIDVRGPAEIVVSTNNHELWSSRDSGKTWDKK